MPSKILLVGKNPDSAWLESMRKALEPIGRLEQAEPHEASEAAGGEDLILIILDAATSDGAAALVSALHAQRPSLPVVVVTDSPTWQRAREILLAGAADYMRKTLDPEAILAAFSKSLYLTA